MNRIDAPADTERAATPLRLDLNSRENFGHVAFKDCCTPHDSATPVCCNVSPFRYKNQVGMLKEHPRLRTVLDISATTSTIIATTCLSFQGTLHLGFVVQSGIFAF